jgi:hypothetical protein
MTRALELMKSRRPDSPNFFARLTLNGNLPPVRAYFHHGGFDQAYGAEDGIRNAVAHLRTALDANIDLLGEKQFLLAAIWGNDGRKTIDVLALTHREGEGWQDNPEVSAYVLEEGFYQPARRDITCGDGLMIFGREEEYRRKTKDIKEYAARPPRKICGLEFMPARK